MKLIELAKFHCDKISFTFSTDKDTLVLQWIAERPVVDPSFLHFSWTVLSAQDQSSEHHQEPHEPNGNLGTLVCQELQASFSRLSLWHQEGRGFHGRRWKRSVPRTHPETNHFWRLPTVNFLKILYLPNSEMQFCSGRFRTLRPGVHHYHVHGSHSFATYPFENFEIPSCGGSIKCWANIMLYLCAIQGVNDCSRRREIAGSECATLSVLVWGSA